MGLSAKFEYYLLIDSEWVLWGKGEKLVREGDSFVDEVWGVLMDIWVL